MCHRGGLSRKTTGSGRPSSSFISTQEGSAHLAANQACYLQPSTEPSPMGASCSVSKTSHVRDHGGQTIVFKTKQPSPGDPPMGHPTPGRLPFPPPFSPRVPAKTIYG